MPTFLTPYLLLIKIAAVVIALGGLAYGVHTYNMHQQNIGYQKAVLEYQVKLNQAISEKTAVEAKWKKQQEDSDAKAIKRQQILQANLATVKSANDSLRLTLANISSGLPSDTQSTLIDRATTLTDILGECSSEVTRLATAADKHVIDLQRFQEQWPKVSP